MNRETEEITLEFARSACYRMDQSLGMIRKSLDHLDEKEVWQRPNKSSNSIGNLLLHLIGNITQYAIASLQGLEDRRERDREFDTPGGYDREELFRRLQETVEEAKQSISGCNGDGLLRIREVQGFQLSGLGIIVHVVEHLSYHTGQIAFWTKALKNKDLGFYDGIDLNLKNS